MFKNLRIRQKLLLSFGFLTFLILVLGLFMVHYLNTIKQDDLPLRLTIIQAQTALAEMRNNEKDFLSTDVVEYYNQPFFKGGKSENVDNWSNNYKIVSEKLIVLENYYKNKKDTYNVNQINDVKTHLKEYHDKFLLIVTNYQKRGFKDFGLEGEMRTAIHAIEKSPLSPEVTALMLNARRNEKDFFLRHDLAEAQKFAATTAKLKTALAGNPQLLSQVDTYIQKFNQIVEIHQVIGLTGTTGALGDMNTAIVQVEPPLSALSDAAIKHTDNDINYITQTILILASLFFIIAIIFGINISQLLSKPLQQMQKAAEEITKGNLGQRIAIDSKDELGLLAVSFNRMVDALQQSRMTLEQDVQTKTHEISEKVVDLENTKKAMVNIMEDMQTDEEAMKEQKNLLDTVVHNIPLGIALTDPGGQAILVNEAQTTLLGPGFFRLRENMEQLYKVTKPDGSAYPYEELTFAVAHREGKAVTKDDLTVQHPDGRKITIRSTSAPIKNQQGQIISIISVFEDITKERDIDRMKTEFISLASHQLRTPLSAIKWFSEMLVGGDAGELTPEQKDFAQNISDSTQRMIDLVNALLNVSRMESGRIVVDPKPTDLKELIDTLVKELQVKINDRQQTLIVSVHQDLPKINVDAKLIRQVYMNLLTNAIKYTPKGGEISVFISKKDNDVISQVSDNGYGIPKFEQTKMFQKFFRATNIIKIETDGTGLGLYLIKAIIESSKGRLWFESFTKEEVPADKKAGTTFWFSLPMSGMEAKKGEVTLDE